MTTVLLVEDSLTDAEVMMHYLCSAGIATISVTNCEDARSKLKAHQPDLVVLDVILPGQSGFELCRELKTTASTKKLPIIICSTKGTDADKLWGTMLGADAYLAKPVDRHELINLILRLVPNRFYEP